MTIVELRTHGPTLRVARLSLQVEVPAEGPEMDTLAGEYVLGVLDDAERREVLERSRNEPLLAAAITAWEQRFGPLQAVLTPVPPPPALWEKLAAATGKSPPTLSIVVPAYNVASYLRAAIDSALDQTMHDLEVIVVDDGSTDATPLVLQAVVAGRRDPRLSTLHQANGGLAAARNAGLAEARGRYIGFLDSDDLWRPEKAARQIALMEADASIGITFSHSQYLTEDGRPTGQILFAGKARPTLHDMIRRNHFGNGSTPIVRRECFDVAGTFRPDLRSCEDYEMWCRILAHSPTRAVLVPEALTQYRVRPTSLSFNFAKFTENADRSIGYLQRAMPDVPRRVLRVGHAEHYRIAAWKAVSIGQKMKALKLLIQATKFRPLLLVRDWRAIGTALALFAPTRLRLRLARFAKSLQQRHALRAVTTALDPPPQDATPAE